VTPFSVSLSHRLPLSLQRPRSNPRTPPSSSDMQASTFTRARATAARPAAAAARRPAAAAAAAAAVAARPTPRSRKNAVQARAEISYVMVKPDGVQRGLVGDIIGRFERKGECADDLLLSPCSFACFAFFRQRANAPPPGSLPCLLLPPARSPPKKPTKQASSSSASSSSRPPSPSPRSTTRTWPPSPSTARWSSTSSRAPWWPWSGRATGSSSPRAS